MRKVLSIAALLASALPAIAADPLVHLLPGRAGASACFQRVYDTNHLKQHPRQAIRSVLLSLRREAKRPDNVVFRMSFADKGRSDAALVGGWCSWRQADANRSKQIPRLVREFPNEPGVVCQWLPYWEVSGEDASLFLIDLDPGGRALTLYLRPVVTLWTGAYMPEPPVLRLGTDDRVFRLERVDAAACAALEDAIADPNRPD